MDPIREQLRELQATVTRQRPNLYGQTLLWRLKPKMDNNQNPKK
jgi:hypothetical protein